MNIELQIISFKTLKILVRTKQTGHRKNQRFLTKKNIIRKCINKRLKRILNK